MKLEKKETKSIKKNENKIVDEFQEVKVQLTWRGGKFFIDQAGSIKMVGH